MISSALFCLAACDDPAPPEPPHDVVATLTKETPLTERRWLELKDKVSPALWLASREAGRDLDERAPEVARIRASIATADARFTEGPRMIANRAVQVQEMLAENGVREAPSVVIESLASLATEADGERAGFGETCQHYVTSRISGLSREDTLAALRRTPLPAAKPGGER
ncbi:hypothetical protein [Methylopila turkensis]|uniref:MxaH protein n=1 Tax=Methylopila turkensis TaxID=1437816 RepID=A0A9W6JPL4_9HYPH|nr:hypothetical protein [Methylopila turkensis]GLK80196.1 hypothetical protein GCM10008174_19370 [Methylopila turkensis]